MTQELMDEWEDLEAYRNLNGHPFDFGNGLTIWEDQANEDVYWKMEQYQIESVLETLDGNKLSQNFRKYKPKVNKHQKAIEGRLRLSKLYKYAHWSLVGWDKWFESESVRLVRYYPAFRRKRAYKKEGNKRVRKSKNFKLRGKGYKKVFDYWCKIY